MRLSSFLLATALAASLLQPARAQSDASTASLLPLAMSVGAVSGAAGALVVVPAALSVGGAVLVVRAVESTARGTVYLLERVSDGARASVEVVSKAAGKASVAVGSSVTVATIASGVVLSTAGEVIAFIPNAVGRALLHNERLSS